MRTVNATVHTALLIRSPRPCPFPAPDEPPNMATQKTNHAAAACCCIHSNACPKRIKSTPTGEMSVDSASAAQQTATRVKNCSSTQKIALENAAVQAWIRKTPQKQDVGEPLPFSFPTALTSNGLEIRIEEQPQISHRRRGTQKTTSRGDRLKRHATQSRTIQPHKNRRAHKGRGERTHHLNTPPGAQTAPTGD